MTGCIACVRWCTRQSFVDFNEILDFFKDTFSYNACYCVVYPIVAVGGRKVKSDPAPHPLLGETLTSSDTFPSLPHALHQEHSMQMK